MEETTRQVLIGIALPAVIGAMAGIGAAALKRRPAGVGAPANGSPASPETRFDEGFVGARALAVVGLTMAFFLSLYGAYGAPTWPPASSNDRMFLLAPLIGAVGLAGVLWTAWRGRQSAGGERGTGWRVSVLTAALGAAVGAVAVVWSIFRNSSAPSGAMMWAPLACALWAGLSAASVGGIARSGGRVSAAVVLVGLAAAVGAGLFGTGTNQIAIFGFGVATATAGWAAAVLLMRGSPGPGAVAVVSGVLGALMAIGALVSNTPWWEVAALGCVAPAAWLVDRSVSRKIGPIGSAIVCVGIAAAIAAIIVTPGVIAKFKIM